MSRGIDSVGGTTESELGAGLSDGASLRFSYGELERRVVDAILTPMRMWHAPRFFGFDRIPAEGPVLLVGNHTLSVQVDAPVLLHEILQRHGRVARGLAENVLMVPGARQLVHMLGGVRGSRANCRTLLSDGQAVLVFPGGGREALRRKSEDKYKLHWKGRAGFARMAIETGAPIVPIAMVGGDDLYQVVLDSHHPLMAPLRMTVRALGLRTSLTPPLIRGFGPTVLPEPERLYYSAAEPIDTTPWADAEDLDAAAEELQEIAQKALADEIDFLLRERDRDRGRTLVGRVQQALAAPK
ncbi:lysophospholipid acyltransferase family protein [Nocardia stercoris]|uniref:Acyltransferase family protein n=1 Tax=Nocardia stercoris TaxID=2483361 RepID=A0A3M2KT41_9NOCA|nr:lysophospholipid acyltransferase family protein [Nocardia stercoris]RMI28619.1 acyltransferase family protein [Nocardia stercoris]